MAQNYQVSRRGPYADTLRQVFVVRVKSNAIVLNLLFDKSLIIILIDDKQEPKVEEDWGLRDF